MVENKLSFVKGASINISHRFGRGLTTNFGK